MNKNTQIYFDSVDMAKQFREANKIAVKVSAICNLEELRALNIAESQLIELFYQIDKNQRRFISSEKVLLFFNLFEIKF